MEAKVTESFKNMVFSRVPAKYEHTAVAMPLQADVISIEGCSKNYWKSEMSSEPESHVELAAWKTPSNMTESETWVIAFTVFLCGRLTSTERVADGWWRCLRWTQLFVNNQRCVPLFVSTLIFNRSNLFGYFVAFIACHLWNFELS